MASRTFLFLVFFASTVTMILSIPQLNSVHVQEEAHILPVHSKPDSAGPHEVVAENVPEINPRTFGNLFNLSSYLESAPNDTAALNFVPLITILSSLG